MTEGFFGPAGLRYRTNAAPVGAPTLVFIHGLSGSSSSWAPYEEALAGRFRLLTLDLRGHGTSAKPMRLDAYRIEELAEGVAALTAHLGLSDVTLVSHSFGSLVALAYLTRRQASVRSSIFLSPPFLARSLRFAGALPQSLLRPLEAWPFRPRGGHVDYRRYRGTGDFNLRRIAADVRNTGARVYLFCLKQASRFPCAGPLARLRIPTLVIQGTDDRIVTAEEGRAVARAIPGAAFLLLADADHMLVNERAEDVIAAIREFAPSPAP